MHDIHYLRTHVTTIGSADTDLDIRIAGIYVSRRHCRIEQRTRGALLMDDGSKNGTYYERERTFGLGLKPLFEDTPVGQMGNVLTPGTTFVVGDRQHRYIASTT
jgi:pSer/pThr/pTyr-binding forkhead associated (FHA) protein